MSWKKSALVLSEVLRLFSDTLNADQKYSRRNMQSFLQQLQTPISEKQNTFSGFFIAFLEYASNLEHFEKKDEHSSLIISEIINSKTVG